MRYDRETRSLPPRTIPTEYMGEIPPVPRRATSLKVPKRLSDCNFFLQPKKSNLKIKTAKMSLQSTWDSASSLPSEKKQVKWMIVEIRHYDRVVGDNPSCSSGPPLSLNWSFSPKVQLIPIDSYEKSRPPRKSQFEMIVPREDREDILLTEWQMSQSMLSAAIRENIRAKNNRRQTVNNLGKMDKYELMSESAVRKIQRILRLKPNPSKIAAELTKQHLLAESQRNEIWLSVSDKLGSSSSSASPSHGPSRSPTPPLSSISTLDPPTSLVTGGGTGIGRAIATELAFLGATVVIASRNHAACQDAAIEISHETQGKVIAGPSTSIRNEEQVQELITFVMDKLGRLDMLVNNAGGQFVCPAEDLSSKGFKAVVDTNLHGTFLVCQQAFVQYMKENGGRIVNITLGNRNGMPLMVHSGAARSGIENMTATLCTEWMESSVRINCVRPGIIFTKSGFDNYGPMGDEFLTMVRPSIPAKRFGTPQEVASAVIWLLSEGASYVTGTVLCVDGGSSYTFLPLLDIDNSKSHLPIYGTLPRKAML